MWIGILSQNPKFLPISNIVVSTIVGMYVEQLTLNGYGVQIYVNSPIHLILFKLIRYNITICKSNLERYFCLCRTLKVEEPISCLGNTFIMSGE
jgi:hypothetical protein